MMITMLPVMAHASWMRSMSRALATFTKDKDTVLGSERLTDPSQAADLKLKRARSKKSAPCPHEQDIVLALDSTKTTSRQKDLFLIPSLLLEAKAPRPHAPVANSVTMNGQDSGRGGSSSGSRGRDRGKEDGEEEDDDQASSRLSDSKFSYVEALSDAKPQRVMEHYFELKLKYPVDYLLLYQIGDFYEFYGKDAERAATLLDITLTSKQCLDPTMPDVKNSKVPFTGFQIRSIDYFLERLIKAGCSAVICDQMPLASSGSTKIQRRVTRVVTPGTLTEENLLEKGRHNYLLALSFEPGKDCLMLGLAWMDLSTGLYVMAKCKEEEFKDHYIRLKPREIIVSRDDVHYQQSSICRFLESEGSSSATTGHASRLPIAHVAQEYFDAELARSKLQDLLLRHQSGSHCSSTRPSPHAMYDFSPVELRASGALLDYVSKTQLDRTPFIEFPVHYNEAKSLRLDGTSLQSLEILAHAQTGERQGSLLAALDATLTAAGTRLLVARLQAPLLHIPKINARLDAVELFVQNRNLLADLRDILKEVPDFERCVQRLCLNRSHSGPKDMLAIKKAIGTVARLKTRLEAMVAAEEATKTQREEGEEEATRDATPPCRLLLDARQRLGNFESLALEIETALEDPPPSRLNEGGLVKEAYDTAIHGSELAQSRNTLAGAEKAIKDLQDKYAQLTGKASLKIIEGRFGTLVCSRSSLSHDLFRYHSQTSSGFRYTTAELNDLQVQFSEAERAKNDKEFQIYEKLRIHVVLEAEGLKEMAKMVAELDVTTAMAQLAVERSYHRPMVTPNTEFCVVNGRHPVIEEIHQVSSRQFIKNDCDLGPDSRFWFITGPNMGGKSTFLRQNALIAIMAQCGFFVPADSATIGVVDAIYTRIGAGDDLGNDQSTFMTEMKETAVILRSATAASLVIMDEVGRGTSPDEGLALAWAICSHLLQTNQCRTLFATHYLQLGELLRQFPNMTCRKTGTVQLSSTQIDFTQRLEPGIATISHGIDVAERASIPDAVIRVAREKYAKLYEEQCARTSLDSHSLSPGKASFTHHAAAPRFAEAEPPLAPRPVSTMDSKWKRLKSKLDALSMDELTGRQAINFLHDLREDVFKS